MKPKQKFDTEFEIKPYMVIFGFVALVLTVYVGFRIQSSERHLIPISVLTLIAGVIFESKRISDKWETVLSTVSISFVLSFLALLPGKGEHNYDFENHIEMLPYAFVLFFSIMSIAFHGKKIVPKLTEGITLLQSIAVIYWVVDYGFLSTNSLLFKSLFVIGVILSLFSVFNAFTYTNLSRVNRLTLSIWSSIVMFLLASDNIYRVYQNEQIENTSDLIHGSYIGLQFFLLGVSSVYIIQNFLMLTGFLPGKGTFFNARYYRELNELINEHVERYSDKQVSILNSFFCVLFSGSIFVLNYYMQVLPRNLAIWAVFVIFPFVLIIYDRAAGRRNITDDYYKGG
jgi:hypothetical protein